MMGQKSVTIDRRDDVNPKEGPMKVLNLSPMWVVLIAQMGDV